MPTYVYKCCGEEFEIVRRMADDSEVECPDPECDEPAQRVWTVPRMGSPDTPPNPREQRPFDFSQSYLMNAVQLD